MNNIDDYYQQKKDIGKRFKQFRELVGKSRKQSKLEDFPKQKPQNHPEVDGRMMW